MRYHIERTIRFNKGEKDSVDDLIKTAHAMYHEGISPLHEGLKANDLESELGIHLTYAENTVLEHLMDIGLVQQTPEAFEDLRSFIIAEWRGDEGEIVNGRADEVAQEAIENLIRHMHSTDPSEDSSAVADGGVTHRSVLSDAFEVTPSGVEERLRSGDLVENVRTAVEAIDDHPQISVREDYGMFEFRNEGYRYRLTDSAVRLYNLS